jgi:4-hydroxy 2-oxovalerate aldolase
MINIESLEILECTLRDGSYRNGFQFTESDTKEISKSLEESGIRLIEIGHGVGLGATDSGYGVAAETDETYMKAASESVINAFWGMFCIPGIASLSHLDMAADYGMSFVRIGVDMNNQMESYKFVERAKQLDMYVCTNFMKSYTVEPNKFGLLAAESADAGSDLVYVVDSAGGMLPAEVARYVDAIDTEANEIGIGFHGHNNLGLAVANCLTAVEHGATLVDGSLQGFGRSAGNAPTEQLLCALVRAGYDLLADPLAVIACGERLIQPLMASKGHSPLDVVAGYAQFHSSYMPLIEKYAKELRVDPRRLIIAVCEIDLLQADEEVIKIEAQRLVDLGVRGSWSHLYESYVGGEQSSGEGR